MKRIILFFFLLANVWKACAQDMGKVWMFGRAANLDFTSPSPVVGGVPGTGGNPPIWNFQHSGAVCDNSGQLLFFVKLHSASTSANSANYPNVFTSTGQAMPNSNLMSNADGDGVPVIVPTPGQSGQFYVFYMKNGGLYYSIVDMTLNAGLGEVLATQKNILISSHDQFIEQKLTAVQGCDCVWLVTRAKHENKYYSYKISSQGISSPVISSVGSLPVSNYGGPASRGGVLKAANNGRYVAVASNVGTPGTPISPKGGLEIYDFEKCSGMLSNPIVLDTIPYFGVCFSPDNTKLYATAIFERAVYQFDVTLPASAIAASKTYIMSNPTPYPVNPEKNLLGDLKLASNGKIYLGNNSCDGGDPSYMHCISSPNSSGTACLPLINNLPLGGSPVCTGLFLPADIVTAPVQDTIAGGRYIVSACFDDSVTINIPNSGTCYRWYDGTIGQSRTVKSPGTYIAYYTTTNCELHTDTFTVLFPEVPTLGVQTYSCPGIGKGMFWLKNSDTTTYTYRWEKAAGVIIRNVESSVGDTVKGLDTGTYRVTLTTLQGCDTTLSFTVQSLPVPVAAFQAPAIACKGDSVAFDNQSSTPLSKWLFEYDTLLVRSPVASFYSTGLHPVVLVVTNVEGCSDTLLKEIEIRDFTLMLASDADEVSKNEMVVIRTDAGEAYSINQWKPIEKFPDRTSKIQHVQMDTSRTFVVFGQSYYGCRDSASIHINVKPTVFLPTAFTPNGDGRNDRFKPLSVGSAIFIRFFYIYDRWGQMVWGGQGPSAQQGWDGLYKGVPAELGTYYYIIEMEDFEGKTITQKGDVTLIR